MSSSKFIAGNTRIIILSIVGIALAGLFFVLNQPIFAGFTIIICGTAALGMIISADVARSPRPILLADLSANHRRIILENAGNTAAEKIQVTAAGIEKPWDIPVLEPDTQTEISLPTMVTNLTIEVTYQAGNENRKSKAFTLGSYEVQDDPFKPTFPLFNWKEKK